MKPLTTLVTPDGLWVLPGTPDFFAALGDSNPDGDPVAFAVKNLGFIQFESIHHSIVQIDLHPRNVTRAALLAVNQKLLSCGDVHLFRIKYFTTSWTSEIVSSAEFAISRLLELCAPPQPTPESHDRFVVEPQDFSLLFEDDPNQMRPMAQKWRVSFGHFEPSMIIALAIRHQLLPRLAIIGVKSRPPDPVWRFLGDDHRWLGGGRAFHTLIGEKVTNISDSDYGEWASGFYRSVAESRRPRYDLITTSIQYHNEDGKPWRPIRYERLLLPWKNSSDEVLVTMCLRFVGSTGAERRIPGGL